MSRHLGTKDNDKANEICLALALGLLKEIGETSDSAIMARRMFRPEQEKE